jgi:hypothetical protein
MADPITPPPELVQQWFDDALNAWADPQHYVAARAAQWGAAQELEACCEWFIRDWTDIETADKLRAARRPKPLSLAEQATAQLDDAVMRGDCITTTDAMPLLRAALKRLAELEADRG